MLFLPEHKICSLIALFLLKFIQNQKLNIDILNLYFNFCKNYYLSHNFFLRFLSIKLLIILFSLRN